MNELRIFRKFRFQNFWSEVDSEPVADLHSGSHHGPVGLDHGLDVGAAGAEPEGEGQAQEDEGDAEKGDC